jgi:hypothetical protein
LIKEQVIPSIIDADEEETLELIISERISRKLMLKEAEK